MHHGSCIGGLGGFGIAIHELGKQRLVERAPVDADAYRLVVSHRGLDHRRKIAVLLGEEADIARIDPVFGKRLGTSGIVFEKQMPIIVKVNDDRRFDTHLNKPVADQRNHCRRFRTIDRDPHEFGTGAREIGHLSGRGLDIGRIGIGHRLHHDRRAAADHHLTDPYAHRFPSFLRCRKAH